MPEQVAHVLRIVDTDGSGVVCGTQDVGDVVQVDPHEGHAVQVLVP